MKCSKCNGEMEKGMLSADSLHWIKEKGFVGSLNKMVSRGFGTLSVWAWRCAKCKKIELTSD